MIDLPKVHIETRNRAVRIGPAVLLLAMGVSAAAAQAPQSSRATSAAQVSQSPPPNFRLETRDNPTIELDRRNPKLSQSIDEDLNTSQWFREIYPLRLGPREAVQFDLTSDAFDPQLQIYDEAGRLLAEDDDGGGNTDARLYFANPLDRAGRFYVVATTLDRRRGTFSLGFRPRPAPERPAPLPIWHGRSVSGNLGPSSPLRLSDQRVYKTFHFEGAAGERVRIYATAKGGPPLELELSRNGIPLALARPEGRAGWPSMLHTLKEGGRHDIAVLGRPDDTSSFELRLIKLPPPQAAAAPQPVTIGQAMKGEFRVDSPVISDTNNRPYSLYRFDARAGQQIAVSAGMEKASPTGVEPAALTVEVGVETPAGFAAIRPAYTERMPGTNVRRSVVAFEGDGPVLIRVAGPAGGVGPFTLKVEPAAAKPASLFRSIRQ